MTNPPVRPGQRSVLIVDDARIIRSMLRTIVHKMSLAVAGEATNGEEAIQMYEDLKPDVVTMDITMPVLDGLTAARSIMKKHPTARIVMVTSVGQESVMREAILFGARDFIVKPFQESRIVSALHRVLEIKTSLPS